MSLFKEHTAEQQAHSLASYLPNGKVWTAKHIMDSNLRRLLVGLGEELLRVEQKQNEICSEADIRKATALISEWEKLLGLPDETLGISGSLENRRNNVLFKLSVFGTSQAEDFVRIAAVLGFTVTVTPADDGEDIPYVDYRRRFVIVVTILGTSTTWPLTWPVLWGGENIDVLKAIYSKIRPAVCTIIYRTEA